MSLDQDIQALKERNRRVEIDKAWETSWTRVIVIALFTYGVAGIWLVTIGDVNPWFKALVPAVGFLLSTCSLPFVKKSWVQKNAP